MDAKIGKDAETFGGAVMGAALALENVEKDLRAMLPRVLASEPSKVVAFKARATQRTADNWREGLNLPQVPHFIMLARQYPELRAKVLEWMDASTGDSGDNPQEVIDQIHKLLAKVRG